MERTAPAGVSCILTNPPFSIADQFIRHGLDLGCDVLVLLRLMALEGAGRSDLIDELRAVIAPYSKRIVELPDEEANDDIEWDIIRGMLKALEDYFLKPLSEADRAEFFAPQAPAQAADA